MTIETELNPGDTGFFICANKIHSAEIESVTIILRKGIYGSTIKSVTYTVDRNPAGSQYTKMFDAGQIFATKERLIQVL